MSLNPYQNLPDTRFWSSGVKSPVSAQTLLCIDPLLNSLSANDSVVSGGSCFAQYIGKELTARNFNYLRSSLSGDRTESFGLGNIYSMAQWKQWLEFTLGRRDWDRSCVFETQNGWVDLLLPHRPTLASSQAVYEHRAVVKDEILKHIQNANLLIFTIGLTETWRNTQGDVFPTCPGTVVGEFDESNHLFHNCTFDEIHCDLESVESLLTSINPSIRLVYTVSPVPLTATASDSHVLLATTYSKATIRAALGQYCAGSTCASYFPSYELISHHTKTDWRFDNNLRSVSESGVDYVMGHAFADTEKVLSRKTSGSQTLESIDTKQEAICEEELLESYSRFKIGTAMDSDILLVGDSHLGKLATGFKAAKIEVYGGMVMNGSGFSDGKFELSDKNIFTPMENEESCQIWDSLYDRLKSMNGDCRIITNIGFQTHRTINRISEHVGTPVLTEQDIASYFEHHFQGQIQILRGLTRFGTVFMVEDPNFYAFISDKNTAATIRDRNFSQYCNCVRKRVEELGITYLNPCNLTLQNQFKDAKSLGDIIASDGLHGTQSYYDYCALAVAGSLRAATESSRC